MTFNGSAGNGRQHHEVAEKYLRKGSKIYVEGALQTRKWTGDGGEDRYSTEVVLQRFRGELTMLDGARGDAAPAEDTGAYAGSRPVSSRNVTADLDASLDDEIPF